VSYLVFAARRSALGRLLLWQRGCVAVSVTLMYWVQTIESIIMLPSLDCSPAILFSHTKYEPERELERILVIESVKYWEYVILAVAWRPLVNTFVQASGGIVSNSRPKSWKFDIGLCKTVNAALKHRKSTARVDLIFKLDFKDEVY